jgi:hypothetical protein
VKLSKLNQSRRIIRQLVKALEHAQAHLDYCNYGDAWEKECAEHTKLPQRIARALKAGNPNFWSPK